jgi:hypothetical protein
MAFQRADPGSLAGGFLSFSFHGNYVTGFGFRVNYLLEAAFD